MRSIHKIKTSAHERYRRHLRVRKKVQGTPERPRLVVFHTSEGLAVEGKGKVARSFALGKLIAAKAKEKGIVKVVFDRGGYQYHGRVKAVADGARKGGLEF